MPIIVPQREKSLLERVTDLEQRVRELQELVKALTGGGN